MADEKQDHNESTEAPTDLSRRDFVAMSIAAGLAAAAGSSSAADLQVVETNVEVKTPDGVCDAAFIHPATGSHPGVGTQGYCMGGPLVVRTAAALPDRIGAGASFHGGGLVTNTPASPHLLAPKIKARMYFGIASNDDMRQPDAKDKLREAFAAAKVPAEIEVYPESLHGWCVPDMPMQNGKPIYNKPDAEKAWAKLVALYKRALV